MIEYSLGSKENARRAASARLAAIQFMNSGVAAHPELAFSLAKAADC
jgi:hypothetical protein